MTAIAPERAQALRDRLEDARDPARAMQIIDPPPPFVTLECTDLADLLAERELLLAVVEAARDLVDAQAEADLVTVGSPRDAALDAPRMARLNRARLEIIAAVRAYRAATTGEAGQ